MKQTPVAQNFGIILMGTFFREFDSIKHEFRAKFPNNSHFSDFYYERRHNGIQMGRQFCAGMTRLQFFAAARMQKGVDASGFCLHTVPKDGFSNFSVAL